jgi:hypothetical protein
MSGAKLESVASGKRLEKIDQRCQLRHRCVDREIIDRARCFRTMAGLGSWRKMAVSGLS